MPDRTITDTLDALGDLLDVFDQITRNAHARFREYRPEDLIELDSRAQAACTYCHMLADADRRFLGWENVRTLDIRGLKLWHFEDPNAVIRFKKMDEDGRSRVYPTKQAVAYDYGAELPGLPMPPVRLTVGYLLDRTGTEFVRTQIAKPISTKETIWCAAIVPSDERQIGEQAWRDVTRQGSLG